MSRCVRVLVTGANGFVGRTLLSVLTQNRLFDVTAAVRKNVRLATRAQVYDIDEVGPSTDWTPVIVGCDIVIHLAARAHVMADMSEDPLAEYRRVNVGGTVALARQAAEAGVRRFVFLSTVKVNGERTTRGQIFRETDPVAPLDPYGRSKAEAESALLGVAADTGMEVVIIRSPLVYGPGAKGNFLTLTRWLKRGIPLPLGAIEGNRRSLVGLDNLVNLIIMCLDHPSAANEVFFAADGEDLSTTDLLRRAATALDRPARLVPVPVPLLVAIATLLGKRDVIQRLCGDLRVDASKARRVLGWNPPLSVDEGLRRALNPPLADAGT